VSDTLDEAKAALVKRYEEDKRKWGMMGRDSRKN